VVEESACWLSPGVIGVVSRDLRSLADSTTVALSVVGRASTTTDLRAGIRPLQPPTGSYQSDNPVMQLTPPRRKPAGGLRFSLSRLATVPNFLQAPIRDRILA
jgi:hypothetical protein